MMAEAPTALDSAPGTVPAWLVVLCVLVSFAGLFNHDLWTPDEPREAAIALEMSRTGVWVVPHLAGEPFIEKPPLYYNVNALLLRAFGSRLGTINVLRLASGLWGLGTLIMTFRLARRLWDRETAWRCVIILATLPGFVQVTHWLLVDNALAFFIVAALWALGEAYVGGRSRMLVAAGAFAAGAFLSKGLIGPILVGLGGLGLFIPWWLARRREGGGWVLGAHAAGLAVFLVLCGAWIVRLRFHGGAALFDEWFWTNHFGRFTGRSTHLGHISGPFYYLGVLPLYVLPWIVVLGFGLYYLWRDLRDGRATQPAVLLPLLWGVGGIVLLSLSSTKREIYLSALLPALAMIGLRPIADARHPLLRIFADIWSAICMGLLALFALGAGAAAIPGLLPVAVSGGLRAWAWPAVLGAAAAAAVMACCRRGGWLARMAGVTAILYIVAWSALGPLLDPHKSYGPGFQAFAARLAARPDLRPIGWNFDETTRAGFYFYADRVFPRIREPDELEAALAGRRPDGNSVIVVRKKSAALGEALVHATLLWENKLGTRRVVQLYQ